jgi:hypothetical protein
VEKFKIAVRKLRNEAAGDPGELFLRPVVPYYDALRDFDGL